MKSFMVLLGIMLSIGVALLVSAHESSHQGNEISQRKEVLNPRVEVYKQVIYAEDREFAQSREQQMREHLQDLLRQTVRISESTDLSERERLIAEHMRTLEESLALIDGTAYFESPDVGYIQDLEVQLAQLEKKVDIIETMMYEWN